jgi:hypothetical protein
MQSIRVFFKTLGDQSNPRSSAQANGWLRSPGLRWAMLLVVLATGGMGFWGYSMLMRLPEFAGCRSVAWNENDSPSLRLHCAQTIAGSHTPDDLFEAIRLVQGIPMDQEFRQTGDRLIQRWSLELVGLAEAAFQKGELQEAIRIARRIPMQSNTGRSLDQQMSQWQEIWSKAEAIYRDAEAEIPETNWTKAFGLAKSLLTVGNDYWATTKYQELLTLIQDAKEEKGDRTKVTKASKPGEGGKLTGTEDLITRWQRNQEARDASHLEKARQLAQSGDAANIRSAISEAYRVLYGNPQYEEAQALIQNWRKQAEIAEDRSYLDRANRLAAKGDERSTRQAIDELYNVNSGRSLYPEARERASQLNQQVQQLRSQPAPDPVPPEPKPINLPPREPAIDLSPNPPNSVIPASRGQ